MIAGTLLAGLILVMYAPDQVSEWWGSKTESVEFTDVPEGEVYDREASSLLEREGLQAVLTHCTACHSAKLVAQNRLDREGWKNLIRWMQETQGLWDLGADEEVILQYLSTHYAPVETGRRKPLTNIQWYELED